VVLAVPVALVVPVAVRLSANNQTVFWAR